jgi:hypothetical protein
VTTAKNGLAAKSGSNLAEGREFDRGGRGRDGPSSIIDSGRPPHRSQRAELPHWALALGSDV